MNKNYRSIWNDALGAWVAVSEIEKAKGKPAGSKVERAVAPASVWNTGLRTLVLVLAFAGISQVYAASGTLNCKWESPTANPDGQPGGYSHSITCGKNARANIDESVAIGMLTTANGRQAVALGANAAADGASSVAIGGDDLTVMPQDLKTKYQQLTGNPLVDQSNKYPKTQTGDGGTAVGVSARAGKLATAFGARAHAQGDVSLSLGVGSHADKENAVAIGAGSTTAGDATAPRSVEINGVTFNFNGGSNLRQGDQVSFGTTGFERQLRNVAPGVVSETSTDGINGSQLYAVAKKLTDVDRNVTTLQGEQIHFYSVSTNGVTDPQSKGNYNNDGATAAKAIAAGVDASATAEDAIAVGTGARATTSAGTVAVGKGAAATGTAAVAVGVTSSAAGGSAVAVGNNSNTRQDNGVAVGNKASARGAGGVSIGTNAGNNEAAVTGAVGNNTVFVGTEAGRNAISNEGHVAVGWDAGKGVNGTFNVAMGYQAGQNTLGEGNIAIGKQASNRIVGAVRTLHTVAIGTNAQTLSDSTVAIGNQSKSNGGSSVALGDRAEALDNQAIAIGQEAKANADWDISIGRRAGKDTRNVAQEGRNIAIGDGALREADAPNNNTALGTDAAALSKGNFNVVIGTYANAPTALSNIDGITAKDKVEASNTVAIGDRAVAYKSSSVGVGARSKALGMISTAVGASAEARGNYSIAQGYSAKADGTSSIAIGSAQNTTNNTQATANFAVAVGSVGTRATGVSSLALGHGAQAQGTNAVAVGKSANVTVVGGSGVAVGQNAQTDSTKGIAIGDGAQAIGAKTANIAIGDAANTNSSAAIVIGTRAKTEASVDSSSAIAIGFEAVANQKDTTAIGYRASTTGASSVALGSTAQTTKAQAVAVGYKTNANGYQSVALGASAFTGENAGSSVAVGREARAELANGVALGSGSVANVRHGAVGADPLAAAADKNNSTWTATTAAVAVGNVNHVTQEGVASPITRQITGVAAGTQDTDAVNVAQLKAAGIQVETSASEGEAATVTPEKLQNGQKLTLDAGKNIKLTQTGGKVSVATKDDVVFNSVAVDGVRIDNAGINSGNKVIAGVATPTADDHAANKAYVDGGRTQVKSANNTVKIVKTEEGGANVYDLSVDTSVLAKTDGTNLNFQYGGNNGTQGTSALSERIQFNGKDGEIVTEAANGSVTFKLADEVKNQIEANKAKSIENAEKITQNAASIQTNTLQISANKAKSEEAATKAAENEKKIEQNTTAIESNAAEIAKGLNFEGNKGTAFKRELGETVAVKGADTNISTTADNGTISIKLAKTLDLGIDGSITTGKTKVTDDGITITPAASAPAGSNVVRLSSDGLDNGGNVIRNIADGQNDSDAVTKRQLDKVADGGWNLRNNAQQKDLVKHNDVVDFANGEGTTAVVETTAENLSTVKFSVNKTGFTVADGTVSAVQTGDVFATAADVAKAINDAEKTSSVVQGNNTRVTNSVQGNHTTYTVHAEKTTVEGAGSVSVVAGNKGTDDITLYTVDLTDTAKEDIRKGAAAKDAVDSKGLKLADGKGGSSSVKKLDESFTISGDANITTTANTNGLQVELNPDVSLTSLRTGSSRLNSDGLTIEGGPSVTKAGIDAAGKKITKVAAGQADDDAVNMSQLKDSDNIAKGNMAALGGTYDAATDSYTQPSYTLRTTEGAAKPAVHTVQDALNSLNQEIEKPLTFAADTGADSTRKLGSTLSIKAGNYAGAASADNLVTENDGNGAITIKLADNPVFKGKVKAQGLDAGGQQITGVAQGTLGTDAVNVDQLKQAMKDITVENQSLVEADSPFAYINAAGDKLIRKVDTKGQPYFVKAEDGTTRYDGNDIVVSALSPTNLQTTVATRVTNVAKGIQDTDAVNTAQLKDVLTALGGGLNEQGETVKPVYTITRANGTTAGTVNTVSEALGHLNDVLKDPITISGNTNNGSSKVVNGGSDQTLGSKLAIEGGLVEGTSSAANVRTVVTDGKVEIQFADAPTFAGKVTANGFDARNARITGVANGEAATDAVNKSQLDAVETRMNAGWGLTANGIGLSKVAPEQSVDLKNTDKNIVISKTADSHDVTFNLAENLTIQSVTAGDSVLSSDGLTIQNGPSVTKNGLDAADTVIRNVAAGEVAAGSKDAVNGGQLHAQGKGIEKVLGGSTVYNPADGTYANTDIGGTGKSNIHEAIESVRNTAGAGWNLTAEGNNSSNVGAGETVDLVSADKNIVISKAADSDKVTFDLADEVTANSVTTGDTVVNNTGVKVGETAALTSDGLTIGNAKNGKAPVVLNSDGLNNGGNAITNIAAGKNSNDAVNVSQLTPLASALGMAFDAASGNFGAPAFTVPRTDGSTYPAVNTIQGAIDHIGTEIRKPIRFAGNTGTVERKLDETLAIKGSLADDAQAADRNIRTKVENGTMTIELAESPKFGKVTVNDGGKITGIESGNVAEGSKEAVNGGQLHAQGKGVEALVGGNTVYNPATGSYANGDIGGTGESTISDAIAAVKNTANTGWNLTAQGKNSSNVQPGETVDLRNTDGNIVVAKADAEDRVSFDLAKTLKVEAVQTGATKVDDNGVAVADNVALTSDGLQVSNPASGKKVSLTSAGLNNGGNVITGLANGSVAEGSQEAVTGDQLFAVDKKVADNTAALNRGLDFAGNSGNFNRRLGERTTIKGGLENTAAASDTNIRTVADSTGNIQIMLADAPVFKGKLTAQGLDAGGQKITNVKDGEEAGDAVNVSQLQRALDNQTITHQSLVQANSPFSYVNSKGEVLARQVDEKGKERFIKVADGSEYTEKDITISSLNPLDPQTAVPTVVGNIADGKKDNDAANIGQLKNAVKALGGGAEVSADGSIKDPVYTITRNNGGRETVNTVGDALNLLNAEINKPLTFAGDNQEVKVVRNLDTELKVKGGANGTLTENNIGVTGSTEDNSLLIQLAEQVNLGENGSVTTGKTVVNNAGVSVGGNVALTSDGLKAGEVNITYAGIDAGGKRITGVKAGEEATDAVNKAQLDAVKAASSNKVAAQGNLTVKEEANDDGSTTYTLTTADDVNFNSVTSGKGDNQVVLDSKGVNVGGNTYLTAQGINANGKKVANVGKGSITADSTDAVNGSQLHHTVASVANLFGGDASVTNDGGISMTNIGGTGANNLNDAIKAVNRAVTVSKVAVVQGDNIVVENAANPDGSTTYKVSTAKDLKVDSVAVGGNTTVDGNGISIANGPSLTVGGLDAAGKKLTNVADGEISATSKEAVNGSQLYQAYQVLGGNNTSINMKDAPANTNNEGNTTPAGTVTTIVTNPDGTKTTTVETNQKVAVSTDKGGKQYTLTTYNVEGQNTYVTNDVIQAIGKMNEQGIKFFHTNDGEVKPVAQGSNQEDSSASGAYATAIGYQTSASGQGAVALGNTYTVVDKDGNKVQGSDGKAKQQRTQASGKNAVAIGTGSQANNENTIAIGTGNIVNGKNAGAIGDPSVINGDNTYSVGNNNTVNSSNTFVLGNSVTETINNSVVLGNEAAAKAVHTTAAGGHYTYAGANDANVSGVNDVVGVVSVGKEGQTRQIQNVAAGVVSPASTDAINGSQLYHTNEAINQVGNQVVNVGNYLNQRIEDVEAQSNAGTAAAMAVAGLPQAYLPGKSMMAVSGSTYRGESGYAVGFSSISDNGNWVIKGTATGNSRGHYGATAGVGYQW
ncbi:YadA-like family protein [Neisseria sp. Dent CA1/247]|uniref:YadA-like family protein n=1 Tax=Neisseria sp. Dent CA1/247 TaxID=2912675 RepID=UPI001FD553FE|nr:YadA-like family protein [Neisseria sp. Dent CA1/247]UOO77421.1 YadA-like family protein [Neisseria sp. Dent CA1/247]